MFKNWRSTIGKLSLSLVLLALAEHSLAIADPVNKLLLLQNHVSVDVLNRFDRELIDRDAYERGLQSRIAPDVEVRDRVQLTCPLPANDLAATGRHQHPANPSQLVAKNRNNGQISLQEAISRVKSVYPGKVLSAKKVGKKDRPMYQIKMLSADGKIAQFVVDGISGSVSRR